MANYTFCCENCGEFTLWYKEMKGDKLENECPDCKRKSKRLFKPPMTFHMDNRVKSRIERGLEPRVVNKRDLPEKQKRKSNVSRPWQAGH